MEIGRDDKDPADALSYAVVVSSGLSSSNATLSTPFKVTLSGGGTHFTNGSTTPIINQHVVANLFEAFGDEWLGIVMEHVQYRLENPGEGHDSHTELINIVAMGMYQAGFTSYAILLYEQAIQATITFREVRGVPRHAGALLTNLGAMHAAVGDFDKALIAFFMAAEEDKETHKIERAETFVFKDLWQNAIRLPLLEELFPLLQAVENTATFEEMNAAFALMDIYEFAFIAYARSLRNHLRMEGSLSNAFSNLQIISAMRNLCALFEIRLKEVAAGGDTFHPAVMELYPTGTTKHDAFEQARRNVGATKNSGVTNADQVRQALTMLPTGTKEERFRKSLVVTYTVRNYTIHQMDMGGPLLEHAAAKEIFGHLLSAFSYIGSEKAP